MPFIGRDWRSPGEAWVKTESLGWQRAKIIESSTIHPSACHMRSCNEYLDTSSCINPRSWPPKTECGKHMPKEKSHQKNLQSTSSARKLSQYWLKVVNSNKINPIDTHTVGIVTDDDNGCCCTKNLNCSYRNNKMISKSVSPDRRCCSSTDDSTSYNNEEHEESSTPSCPRSESANSSSSLFENYSNEQELLTSTPTVHQRTASPNPSCTPRLSPSKSSSIIKSQQQQQSKKLITPPILVKMNNEMDSSLHSDSNASSPSANEPQSLSYNEDERQQSNTSSPWSSAPLDSTSDGVNINNPTILNNHPITSHSYNSATTCCHHHNHHSQLFSSKNSANSAHHITVKQAPHCQITLKPTREVATYNTISEAFYRLDFCNAIHDIRRFNYICKLLHLLITQNLTSLSGCATRILFTMLEQVAWQVASNKQNIHILYNLLDDLKKMIQKYYCWGRPIGSSLLWQQHFCTIERISHLADQIDIAPPPNNNNRSQKTISDLPAEMIHEIMLRLNDYRDLVNLAEASSVMQSILNGQHIWRQLCKYHFSKQQLRLAIENHYGLSQTRSWSSNVKFARFVSADGRSICRKPVNQFNRNRLAEKSSSSQIEKAKQFVSENNVKSSSHDQNKNQHRESSFETSRLNPESSNQTHEQDASLFGNSMPTTSKSSQQLDKVDEIENLPLTDMSPITDRKKAKHSEDNIESNPNIQVKSESHEYPTKPSLNTGKEDSSTTNSVQTDKTRLRDSTNLLNRSENTNSDNCKYRHQEKLDWEQVFHQLRKKFGLKEEYADCLLLCRHCRCLFWKSFGHPCIKNEPITEDESSGASSSNGKCHLDQPSQNQERVNENIDDQPRASVAVLSQSYLQNANNQSGSNSGNYNRNIKNNDRRQQQTDNSNDTSSHLYRDRSLRNNIGSSSPMSRSMLLVARSNLVQQPQSLSGSDSNSSRSNHQRSSHEPVNRCSQQQSQQQHENSNSVNHQQSQTNPCSIPSHVAISPQAFLKFFSL